MFLTTLALLQVSVSGDSLYIGSTDLIANSFLVQLYLIDLERDFPTPVGNVEVKCSIGEKYQVQVEDDDNFIGLKIESVRSLSLTMNLENDEVKSEPKCDSIPVIKQEFTGISEQENETVQVCNMKNTDCH